jgi:hypothetical protein
VLTRLPARLALGLYPPAWRDRYGDEILALLDESGGGPVAALSLAAQALPMWICPPRHLYDAEARMRGSVATVLAAWSLLAGVGIVFMQLSQLRGFAPPDHPVIGLSYLAFDAALGISVLVAAAGGVPLWLAMLRQARRAGGRRDLAGLALPVAVPVGYLLAAALMVKLVRHPEASGPWWFIGFTVAGFLAVIVAAGSLIVAMRRLRPRGWAVRLAARAAGLAAATIALAGLASAVAASALSVWVPGYVGYHDGLALDCYLLVVIATGSVALVSAVRGRPDNFGI